jgi:hypothetical protein
LHCDGVPEAAYGFDIVDRRRGPTNEANPQADATGVVFAAVKKISG